jgi:hypothetical protein
LFADGDGVVADAFECAGGECHRHGPFARVGVLAGIGGEAEDLAVDAVDVAVSVDEVFGHRDVALDERAFALGDFGACKVADRQDAVKDLAGHRRLVAGERDECCDGDALVAHSLGVAHDVQQCGDES